MSTNNEYYILEDPLFLWNLQAAFCPDVLLEEIDEMGEDFYRSFYENGETPMDEILERRKKEEGYTRE